MVKVNLATRTRCPATGSDGRRCTLLEGHEKKHLVASDPISLSAASTIMLRRGWGMRSAYQMLRALEDSPPQTVERFMGMLKVSETAGLHLHGPTAEEMRLKRAAGQPSGDGVL